MTYESFSCEETENLAAELAKKAQCGALFCLTGDLGAGKTAFARGFARGLGISDDVTSPTFAIINVYQSGRLPLYHFDVYRIKSPAEMEDTGYEEYFYGDGVSLVEWADMIKELIPDNAIWVRINKCADANHRHITIERGKA